MRLSSVRWRPLGESSWTDDPRAYTSLKDLKQDFNRKFSIRSPRWKQLEDGYWLVSTSHAKYEVKLVTIHVK